MNLYDFEDGFALFGYIKPDTPELLVRESEQYKAVYCSLCKALGKHYGVISRLTLSYDCTFLSLFLLGTQPECKGYHRGRCVVNPLKKCNFCKDSTEALRMPAAFSVLSMYQKLWDDLHDSGFLGKIRSLCLMPLAIRPYRKACRDYPDLAKALSRMMREQTAAEQDPKASLDSCAEPTARMLSHVFASTAQEETQKRIYETIGYFLGKWIYLIDAADDLEDDLKKGSFNPLIVTEKLTKHADEKQIKEAKESCNGALNLCVSQIIASVNLLSFYQYGPIIGNIVEKGLPEMQRMRLFEKEKTT